jgi:hypothetical protein
MPFKLPAPDGIKKVTIRFVQDLDLVMKSGTVSDALKLAISRRTADVILKLNEVDGPLTETSFTALKAEFVNLTKDLQQALNLPKTAVGACRFGNTNECVVWTEIQWLCLIDRTTFTAGVDCEGHPV